MEIGGEMFKNLQTGPPKISCFFIENIYPWQPFNSFRFLSPRI